jgi:POT family proton-dependent oligopeptide transporter
MALWLLTVAAGEFFDARFNAWDLRADGTRKLTDYQYFTFFTWLMLAASIVFVFVARYYKGQTYLQSQRPTLDEIATEPIVAGGTPT